MQRKYHWGLDVLGTLQGAGGVGGLLKLEDGGSSYRPRYDGNGNIWQWINSSSTVVEKYEYDAFGKITNSGTFSMPLRFSSKFYDEETGLYYYGFRYYDPETGSWVSRDPIGEDGGLNLYGFVFNDSVGDWDYLGMDPPF